ncbi:hypothetical protein BAUCODRAFT_436496 [Baudoinia panamericana UAMH 10762]|uniref:Uncharacterized protein n=1 Tax=Baudoinia panamericana (strain UAMH 10762) TaxID=717646 RepID=M2MK33_BAUPA|nr:uncharacterized protein BAUCODRAFT_436496 [Baudoinia panamericana UAMH 10762]EMC97046.1 hypothetical protein BAUCODRAFT_436496 [Baudoinia panamericana UAMH 10762]
MPKTVAIGLRPFYVPAGRGKIAVHRLCRCAFPEVCHSCRQPRVLPSRLRQEQGSARAAGAHACHLANRKWWPEQCIYSTLRDMLRVELRNDRTSQKAQDVRPTHASGATCLSTAGRTGVAAQAHAL